MIKIFLILILLSLFSLLVVLLIKEVKEKSYLSDHFISKIIEFILDEDITFGILFMIIILIIIIIVFLVEQRTVPCFAKVS